MFSLKPGAHTSSARAALVVFGVAACGGAAKTPFYDSPTPLGSASMTAVVSTGGNVALGGTGGGIAATSNGGTASTTARGGASGAGGTSSTAAGGAPSVVGGHGGAPATHGGEGNVNLSGGEGGNDTASEAGAPSGNAGAPPEPNVDCSPHGALAQPFEGHCYEFESKVATWSEAVSTCEGRGAHLVTISSEGRTVAEFLAENDFVWQLAGSAPNWIGATDGQKPHAAGNGTYYTWITGEPMTLDNWSSGQPNNAQSSCQDNVPCSCDRGACYEHCGYQWDTAGRQLNSVPGWNDRVCDHVLSYVCEWDD